MSLKLQALFMRTHHQETKQEQMLGAVGKMPFGRSTSHNSPVQVPVTLLPTQLPSNVYPEKLQVMACRWSPFTWETQLEF